MARVVYDKKFTPSAQDAYIDDANIHAWRFNVALECDGRAENPLEVAIGGAVLNLHDLRRILDALP